ncbi:PRD domain-containing protein [Peptoniphilaceae bacterium SGI.137]|nr:PRD domain-containing protein [Peptoniphilaceae bacterium]MDY3986684.1 PRD domain-containing protein [Peptoniphilaceae bacterium]MDY4196048.1 PRD domain-containing protein [Peptoniphilaceae bacterium]MDY5841426.1 PRD domain-containing protein [Peptoniphilaceae bacterium]MDY6146291.1 PRD domain-containing protein [Peptoniphilaceae bacterium]
MLKQRIEILRSASMIDDIVAEYVNAVIDQFLPQQYEESKMEMFTTHLAMATQRALNHGEVEMMDDGIWKDVQMAKTFLEAKEVLRGLKENAPVEIPESEDRFLLMHLCNLLEKEG